MKVSVEEMLGLAKYLVRIEEYFIDAPCFFELKRYSKNVNIPLLIKTVLIKNSAI